MNNCVAYSTSVVGSSASRGPAVPPLICLIGDMQKLCIINTMALFDRVHKKNVRMDDDEALILEAMMIFTGADASTVFRQGLLRFARQEGITLEAAAEMVAAREGKKHKRPKRQA